MPSGYSRMYGRVHWKKGKQPYKRLAKRVATRSYVHRAINRNIETKQFFTTAGDTETMSYDAPIIVDMTAVVQGDGGEDRDGDKIKPLSLSIKGYVGPQDLTSANMVYCRHIIVQWFPDSAVEIPAIADFWPTATTAFYAPITVDKQMGKYKVLMDRRFLFADETVANQFQLESVHMFNYYLPAKRLARKNITFTTTGATTGCNHIYMISFSSVTNASGNDPAQLCQPLLRFKDI